MTGAAVAVGEVVQHKTDDGLLAPRLSSAGIADGVVDVAKEENVGDPDKGADLVLDVLHLGRVGLVSAGQEGLASPLERLAVLGVDEQAAANKGVAGLACLKGRGTACGKQASENGVDGAHVVGSDC